MFLLTAEYRDKASDKQSKQVPHGTRELNSPTEKTHVVFEKRFSPHNTRHHVTGHSPGGRAHPGIRGSQGGTLVLVAHRLLTSLLTAAGNHFLNTTIGQTTLLLSQCLRRVAPVKCKGFMLRERVRGQEENVDINRRKTEQFFSIRQDITVIETFKHTRARPGEDPVAYTYNLGGERMFQNQ